ncbi:MAG: hypothetical protein GEU99_24285 [Luteitalea sp.]|nr:hypothetical protein [Luteitalea sp.]
MFANVVFYLPANVVEIVAHELEHVLEQVDGVPLQRLARVRGSGVAQVGPEDYETERASDVGRRVSTELDAARRERTDARPAEPAMSLSAVP